MDRSEQKLIRRASADLEEKVLKKMVRSDSLHEKLSAIQTSQNRSVRRTRSVTISEPQPTRIQPKFSKNSRRSRNGAGRGLPKKGGAGGKGVWGVPGSELLDEALDRDDPNYDPETMDDFQLEVITVLMTDQELKAMLETLILEYYGHGETSEVDTILTEKSESIGVAQRYLVVVVMIEMAMDHKASHREMTSVLLSDLYQECITQTDICRGFDALLESLSDLILDCPGAPTILGNFMARAVADDCLPPKYLQSCRSRATCSYAIKALDRASLMLRMKHGMALLDSVWGVGGPRRPVRLLVKQMTLLLKEFLLSRDASAAISCLEDLEVPHFHHELVFEAIVMAMERGDTLSINELMRLLKKMYNDGVITTNQMDEGYLRVFDNMSDIVLDVPMAYSLLERIMNISMSAGIVSREVSLKMPSKGRKRFVSEGDGGRFKQMSTVDGFHQ